ncbi:hypothetical protein NUU61_009279 [Penicillium alfredii]|uniref:Ribosomal protein L27/L41, mitochondrial n=1 Tax=Penicillium alfredii TaxID=1506179 RepID=A0A9W9EMY9_9EURO|nr:uncharacterized protein NUU61_009279 [Penicillium alfredii]KAJ5084700.1 hypothetical protein NUU61_009279 [Penicillium alfredii]
MVKPSQPMMARLRLTTKQVNGGYYKGNRTGSMGSFRKNGSYQLDRSKIRNYIVPEMSTFKLTPFVTKRMEPTKDEYWKEVEQGGKTVKALAGFQGIDFLQKWADDNPGDYDSRQEREAKEQRNAQGRGIST